VRRPATAQFALTKTKREGFQMTIQNLTPAEVSAKLHEGSIVLIDVRETSEFASERIHGALLFPLSTFDPAALPDDGKRPLVFQCGSGMRSAKAVAACAAAGFPHNAHLAGGIQAWKAAGLPTISLDPSTGKVIDRG
jgi:rhodanese-related sulfurtransferase